VKHNRTAKETCDYCLDTGYVVVEGPDDDGYDEALGPCPFCEVGQKQESPDLSERTAIRPPWGSGGYWRGRDTSFLVPQRKQHFALSPEDQRMYLRAALRELGMMELVKDLNEEIEPGGDEGDVREVQEEERDVDHEHVQHADDLLGVQAEGDGPPTLL
jgi:hypothetical protein